MDAQVRKSIKSRIVKPERTRNPYSDQEHGGRTRILQIVPTDLYNMVSDGADESMVSLGDMTGQILAEANTITVDDLKAARALERTQDLHCNYCRLTAIVPSESWETFRDTAQNHRVNLNSLMKAIIRKYYNLL